MKGIFCQVNKMFREDDDVQTVSECELRENIPGFLRMNRNTIVFSLLHRIAIDLVMCGRNFNTNH